MSADMTGVSIAERFAAVRRRVDLAAEGCGRDPATVRIVAVSKRHSIERVRAAVAAGVTRLGENYAQELAAKAADFAGGSNNSIKVEWHFIGHLQRNKVKQVVGIAALVHAVDSARLLRALDNRARAVGVVQPVLLEVNIASEASKAGIAESETSDLVSLANELPNVRVDGLMTMPPLAEEPDDNRQNFRRLRELRERLASAATPLPELSMGTTADYDVAVEEGATLVRVGTAIFGPRPVYSRPE